MNALPSIAALVPPALPDAAALAKPADTTLQAVYLPADNDPDGACFAEVRAGQTISEILGPDATHSLRVAIGWIEVPRAIWGKVRPKCGQRLHVTFYPQGGSARKWILTIVAIVATVFTAGAAAGASWALIGGLSATTVMVGGALIAVLALAMIPPPSMRGLGKSAADPLDQLQSLTGTSNQAAPYGVIPCVVGNWRMFPPHAAMPYTEISGNDQYMRMLLDFGYGDLDVSDLKIGDTALSSYDDVEYEITTTPTLFTQDIAELQVGTALKLQGDTDTRTTQVATTEISLDIAFPSGLFGVNDKGNTTAGTVDFTIQYRATGDTGAWSSAATASGLTLAGNWSVVTGQFEAHSQKREVLRLGARWKVPTGQYDVKVTRGTESFPGAMANTKSGDAAWAVLRSINPQNPSTTGTLKLAVRIKATDQLHGVVSQLSAQVAQKVRRWDKATQTWLAAVASDNPAWVRLWLLTQCPATTVHVPDDQIDLDGFADWAAACDADGLVYSGCLDSPRVLAEVDRDVMACGMATFGMKNGKYSVIRDIAQTVPMQVYTPVNGTSITWTRNFTPPPHALRVSFTNPQQKGQQDERIVYWDGYNADGSGGLTAATRFEKLDLRNVTDPAAAWKIARYHLAVMWLRPNTYQQTTDFEHLVNDRGDLVEVSGPVLGWGVAYGRIKSVSGSTLVLDMPVPVEGGKSYALRLRFDTAFSDTSAITIDANDHTHVTMTTPIAGAAAGQLFVIGEVNKVSTPLLITGIEPAGSMLERTATLTLVDAAPGVWTAADGTPPPFVSSINNTPWCAPPDPPVVSIRSGDSAPDDAGVIHAKPGISSPPGGGIHRLPIFHGPGSRGPGGFRFSSIRA